MSTRDQHTDLPRYDEQQAEPQRIDPQHVQPTQHGDAQPGDAQHGDAQYADQQHTDPGYADPQYTGGQDPDPAYADPQYTGAQSADPQGTGTGARSADPEYTGRQDPDPAYADQQSPDRSGTAAEGTMPAEPRRGDDMGHPEGAGGVGSATPRASTAGSDTDADSREPLVSTERADSYGSRWDAVKGTFVDEPRRAVAEADALVGELLTELETLFREQRRSIEHGLDTDETSTEDMRLALRRYRSFFDRLLTL